MAKLTTDEPILVVSAAGSLVSYAGAALVSHGVIGADALSSTEQTVVPIVAAGFVLALGLVGRAVASPYAKVKAVLEKDGLLSDADFARIEGVVAEYTGVDLDPGDDTGAAVEPASVAMDAGAPAAAPTPAEPSTAATAPAPADPAQAAAAPAAPAAQA